MVWLTTVAYNTCRYENTEVCPALLQDVTVGKLVKPQLAKMAFNPEHAMEMVKAKQFLVETKFDGALCPMP